MAAREDLVVRPIRQGEEDILAELAVAAYRADLGPALSGEYAAVLRAVTDHARTDEVLVAVDDDGRVLGGVTLVLDPDSPNAEFPERTWKPSRR